VLESGVSSRAISKGRPSSLHAAEHTSRMTEEAGRSQRMTSEGIRGVGIVPCDADHVSRPLGSRAVRKTEIQGAASVCRMLVMEVGRPPRIQSD